jgi:hypothetical protein
LQRQLEVGGGIEEFEHSAHRLPAGMCGGHAFRQLVRFVAIERCVMKKPRLARGQLTQFRLATVRPLKALQLADPRAATTAPVTPTSGQRTRNTAVLHSYRSRSICPVFDVPWWGTRLELASTAGIAAATLGNFRLAGVGLLLPMVEIVDRIPSLEWTIE